MDPAFWGKSTWLYLHTLTFNYPLKPTEEDRIKYYNHFKQLGDMLPCPSCAESYKIYFKYIPINYYLDDIYGITYWLYIIHYLVNRKLSKKNSSFYEVVTLYYTHKSTKCTSNKPSLEGKCTAAPSEELTPSIDKYNEFKNAAESKYLNRTIKFIQKLLQNHPNLQA